MSLTTFVRGTALAAALTIASLAAPSPAVAQLKSIFCWPTPAAPYLLPYIVAKDLGWYQKWGLDAQEVIVQGDTNCTRLVLQGEADVSALGPNIVMNAILKGGEITTIVSWMPISDYRFVVPKDSPIKAFREVAEQGLTLAASDPGGMPAEYPKMIWEKHGVKYDKVSIISVGGMGARLQAVIAGKADATLVDTFSAVVGETQGKTRILVNMADEFPGLSHLSMVALKKSLNDPQKRAALRLFVWGGIEGARYIQKDPDGAADVLKKRTPTIDIEITRKVLRALNAGNHWGINGGLEPEITKVSGEAYAKRGMIPQAMKYEEVVDPSLVDEVLKEIGKL